MGDSFEPSVLIFGENKWCAGAFGTSVRARPFAFAFICFVVHWL